MIQVKKYLPVSSKIFYSPLMKENLRLEFSSSEDKLNDLSLITAIMLRDKKSVEDIATVTLLPKSVIESVLSTLTSQGLIDVRDVYNLPERIQKILELSNCINFFNVSAPPIFFDVLGRSPVVIKESVALKNSSDDTNCAAFVKNSEQVSMADFEEISIFVRNFMLGHGARDFLDDLKVLRLNQQAEIFFAARELRFLPVVGENNFDNCVEIDSEQTIQAELPVRKFKLADGKEFNVDLLFETTFTSDEEEEDSKEIFLSFKPNSDYLGDNLTEKFFKKFMGEIEDKGLHYVKILVSKKVAGGFL